MTTFSPLIALRRLIRTHGDVRQTGDLVEILRVILLGDFTGDFARRLSSGDFVGDFAKEFVGDSSGDSTGDSAGDSVGDPPTVCRWRSA